MITNFKTRRPRARSRTKTAVRGYNGHWQRYSKQRLVEYPLCARCGGGAMQTDHIERPLSPDDPLFWDTTNHQSLCDSCHGAKTQTEIAGAAYTRDGVRFPALGRPDIGGVRFK